MQLNRVAIKGNGIFRFDVPVRSEGLDVVFGPADVLLDGTPYALPETRETLTPDDEFQTRVNAYLVALPEGGAAVLVDETVLDGVDVSYAPPFGPGMPFKASIQLLSALVPEQATSLDDVAAKVSHA